MRYLLHLPLFRALGILGLTAALPVAAATEPAAFELNKDRVKVSAFGGSLAAPSKRYFVPTVYLMVSGSGSVWAQSKSGSANAQSHAKFYVNGLDKALLQGLAKQIQDDLVAKLRTAGNTVLTFEDLKDAPLIAGHGRTSPDAKWGLPTTSNRTNLTYLVATPSDAQALDRPINGPVWWLKDIAKEKDLLVLVPEIILNVPIVYGETSSGYKRAESSVALKPAMKLMGATITTANAKGGTATIQVQEHGTRLVAEVAGSSSKLSEDKTNFSSTWGRSSVDFMFTLDVPVFSAATLRVGSQLNELVLAEIAKAKK